MNSPGIDKKIQKIFKDLFNEDDVSLETSFKDVAQWNSLGHIDLINALEKEFSVYFTFSELAELTNVNKIASSLRDKGVL